MSSIYDDTTEYTGYDLEELESETENELSDSSTYWEESSRRAKKRKQKALIIKIGIVVLSVALIAGIVLLAAGNNGGNETIEPPHNEILLDEQSTDETAPVTVGAEDTLEVSSNATNYSSDGYFRYFRSQLNEELQLDYDTILSAIEFQNSKVRLDTADLDRIEYVVERVHSDNPECFWFGDSYKAESFKSSKESYSIVSFDYDCKSETAEKRQKEIDSIVEPLVQSLDSLTEYEKVKSVYEYIISNTAYDSSVEDQGCYSVLVDGRGVCAGYASAMQLVLNRIGIDTIFVKGTADGETHAWNLVKIDGCWYQLDATWGDPVSSNGRQYITYDYFLLTDSEMLKDHTYDKGMEYPKCNCTCEKKKSDSLEEHLTLSNDTGLSVHFIDVGQADAALIICDGEAMMIDGGNADDSQLIYSYLKRYGIDELKYVVCTHPHEDHVGGLSGALNLCQADNVFCTMTDFDTKAFQSFKKYTEKQGKKITIPNAGEKFSLGSSEFTVLAPESTELISDNTSIIVRLNYGERTFLFMGDAEYEDEQQLLNGGNELKCDVLKIGHHGSYTSTGYQFLYETSPDYAVISVGADNPYGHPDETVISRLNDAEVEIYRTDKNGTIICICDGININFETER